VPRVCIALGSNLGDRRAHLEWAVGELNRLVQDVRVSGVIETEPQEVAGPQPAYLNAVVIGETRLGAEELLQHLIQLEEKRGRERAHGWHAPRTLDLDLILYGDAVIESPGLVVPHPRFRERWFVLAPLVELEPEWKDPVSGKTVQELLLAVSSSPTG